MEKQFSDTITNAFSNSKSVLSAVQYILDNNIHNESKENLLEELIAYDQSTQATLNTPISVLGKDEFLYANWFQDGFMEAFNFLEK